MSPSLRSFFTLAFLMSMILIAITLLPLAVVAQQQHQEREQQEEDTVLLSSSSSPPQETYTYTLLTDEMRDLAKKIRDKAFSTSMSHDVWDLVAMITDLFPGRVLGSDILEAMLSYLHDFSKNDKQYNETISVRQMHVPSVLRWSPVLHENRYKPEHKYEWASVTISDSQVPGSLRNHSLHMVSLGNSNNSFMCPNKVCTGELLVFSDDKEFEAYCSSAETPDRCRGKIILFDAPFVTYGKTVHYRSMAATWGAKYGAVAACIRSVASYSMQNPHTGVGRTANIPSFALSIEDAMMLHRLYKRGLTLTVSVYMEGTFYPKRASSNVIWEIKGSEKPDEIAFSATGHCDAWFNAAGAMDDGGGFLAAYGYLRLLSAIGYKPKRTLQAWCAVGEENDGSPGGAHYADTTNTSAISLLLESDEGPFSAFAISFSGHLAAFNQLTILSEALKELGADKVYKGGGGEDVNAAKAKGVPVCGLTTRDARSTNASNNVCRDYQSSADFEKPGLGEQNGITNEYFWFHHSSADTIDKLDPTQLQQNAAVMATWAMMMDLLPSLLPRNVTNVPPLPPSSSSSTSSPSSSAALTSADKAGIAITLVGVAIILFAVYWFKFKNNNNNNSSNNNNNHETGGNQQRTSGVGRSALGEEESSMYNSLEK